MAGFLDKLRSFGLYGQQGGAAAPNPYGLPDEMVGAARSQSLMGLGGQLLAASVARDPRARAEAFGGMADAADMSRPLYNMAQAKLMATPKERETRTATEEIDGRIKLINMETGAVIQDLGAAPAKGNSGLTVNNVLPGGGDEDEFQKKRAGTLAARLDTFEEGANNAPMKIGQLQTLSDILSGIEQGTFAEQKGMIVSTLQSMGAPDWAVERLTGLDPNLPGSQQAAKKIIAEMTISQIGPGGFPAQNFSNADLQFLRESQVSLNALPEANALRIKMGMIAEQAKMDAAIAWREYKTIAREQGIPEGDAFEMFQEEYRQTLDERAKAGETYFGGLKEEIAALKKRGGGAAPGANQPRSRQQILQQYNLGTD